MEWLPQENTATFKRLDDEFDETSVGEDYYSAN